MNSPNRIDPLAPPPPKKEAPAMPWWRPWAIRVGASVVGAALGASCPLWPPGAQPICVAVSSIVKGAASLLPEGPPPSEPRDGKLRDDDEK